MLVLKKVILQLPDSEFTIAVCAVIPYNKVKNGIF